MLSARPPGVALLKGFDAKHNLEPTLVGCVSGSGLPLRVGHYLRDGSADGEAVALRDASSNASRSLGGDRAPYNEWQELLQRQRAILEERRRDGHDVTQSKALLQVMEELQQKHIDHLDLIGKEFEKLEWPSFRRSPKRLDRAYSAQMALSGADVERAWNSFRRRAHSRCHSK